MVPKAVILFNSYAAKSCQLYHVSCVLSRQISIPNLWILYRILSVPIKEDRKSCDHESLAWVHTWKHHRKKKKHVHQAFPALSMKYITGMIRNYATGHLHGFIEHFLQIRSDFFFQFKREVSHSQERPFMFLLKPTKFKCCYVLPLSFEASQAGQR